MAKAVRRRRSGAASRQSGRGKGATRPPDLAENRKAQPGAIVTHPPLVSTRANFSGFFLR